MGRNPTQQTTSVTDRWLKTSLSEAAAPSSRRSHVTVCTPGGSFLRARASLRTSPDHWQVIQSPLANAPGGPARDRVVSHDTCICAYRIHIAHIMLSTPQGRQSVSVCILLNPMRMCHMEKGLYRCVSAELLCACCIATYPNCIKRQRMRAVYRSVSCVYLQRMAEYGSFGTDM